MEAILDKKRYLTGPRLTEADVRLFMTLIRFDEAYVVNFKTNRNAIHEFPNMSNYVKELFQTPGTLLPSICQELFEAHLSVRSNPPHTAKMWVPCTAVVFASSALNLSLKASSSQTFPCRACTSLAQHNL